MVASGFMGAYPEALSYFFGVRSIKLFLNSCFLNNVSNIKNRRWQQRDLWSYVNDAIRMKSFY